MNDIFEKGLAVWAGVALVMWIANPAGVARVVPMGDGGVVVWLVQLGLAAAFGTGVMGALSWRGAGGVEPLGAAGAFIAFCALHGWLPGLLQTVGVR